MEPLALADSITDDGERVFDVEVHALFWSEKTWSVKESDDLKLDEETAVPFNDTIKRSIYHAAIPYDVLGMVQEGPSDTDPRAVRKDMRVFLREAVAILAA